MNFNVKIFFISIIIITNSLAMDISQLSRKRPNYDIPDATKHIKSDQSREEQENFTLIDYLAGKIPMKKGDQSEKQRKFIQMINPPLLEPEDLNEDVIKTLSNRALIRHLTMAFVTMQHLYSPDQKVELLRKAIKGDLVDDHNNDPLTEAIRPLFSAVQLQSIETIMDLKNQAGEEKSDESSERLYSARVYKNTRLNPLQEAQQIVNYNKQYQFNNKKAKAIFKVLSEDIGEIDVFPKPIIVGEKNIGNSTVPEIYSNGLISKWLKGEDDADSFISFVNEKPMNLSVNLYYRSLDVIHKYFNVLSPKLLKQLSLPESSRLNHYWLSRLEGWVCSADDEEIDEALTKNEQQLFNSFYTEENIKKIRSAEGISVYRKLNEKLGLYKRASIKKMDQLTQTDL